MQHSRCSINRANVEWAILGVDLMKPSKRAWGKIFTYLGLFLTGIGIIGVLGPHLELSRAGARKDDMAVTVDQARCHQPPAKVGSR